MGVGEFGFFEDVADAFRGEEEAGVVGFEEVGAVVLGHVGDEAVPDGQHFAGGRALDGCDAAFAEEGTASAGYGEAFVVGADGGAGIGNFGVVGAPAGEAGVAHDFDCTGGEELKEFGLNDVAEALAAAEDEVGAAGVEEAAKYLEGFFCEDVVGGV